ncbi:MAG: TonB-dependent receptor [Bacteroidota bacterium]
MPVFYPMGETTFGNINLFGVQATLPTYNLKPEMTNSIEIGGDFKFFMNRLGIDLTYYNALTKNQLLDVDVPTSSGFSVWMKNAGSILNKGVELQIYGSVIQSEKGFNWDAMLNWSTNKNKITELEGDMEELHITTMYGNYSEVSLMAFLDDEWGAIYGSNMEKNDAGVVLVDEDGVPIQTTDPEILGYVNPDWIGGLRNTFSFKGITLSALIDFRKGGDVFSWTKAVGQHAGILQSTVDDGIREDGMIVDAVYAEGTMLDLDGDGTAEDVSGLANQTRISASDYWRESRNWGELSIVDGSFIKLREIVISYNLPLSFITKIGLQNASVSVYGRNLALLYTHKSNDVHIDPEVSSGGTVSGSGMESYQLPPSRTIGIKLNVKF